MGIVLSAALVFEMLSAGGVTAHALESRGEVRSLSERDGGLECGGAQEGGGTQAGAQAGTPGDASGAGQQDGGGVQESVLGNASAAGRPGGGDGGFWLGEDLAGDLDGDSGEDLSGDLGGDSGEDLSGDLGGDSGEDLVGDLDEDSGEDLSGDLAGEFGENLGAAREAAYSLAAEGSGGLDFSDGNTATGDLETDGYQWDAGSKTLKLKNATISNAVILPDDTVTIETEGTSSIDTLAIAGGSPNKTHLTFSGTGELTVENQINISGGNKNILTVEQGVRVIAKGGISIGASGGVDSVVTVNGTLTAMGDVPFDVSGTTYYNNAISAGKVVVGAGGLLNVSGKNGVVLNGMNKDSSGNDFTGVFTVEKGGCFTADCENFNVRVQSGGSFSAESNADKAISIPDGYLPTDCKVQLSEEVIDFVRISTDIVYTGPMSIHENHDFSGDWKKDETAHWKECKFAGCDKKSGYAMHRFDSDAWKCTVCGSALNITLNGAEGLVYNGLAQKPGVTVTVDGVALEASKYDTVYRDNIDAGEAYATVAGKDGLGFERTEAFRIAKATPAITWGSAAQTVVYSGSQAKIAPPTVTLVNGEGFEGEIIYSYTANGRAADASALPTDAGTYNVKASIKEQGNYTAAESGILTLTVEQADHPLPLPPRTMNVARKYDKVGMVELPEKWEWQEADKDTALEIEVPLAATAVYTGEDKANYKNVTCAVTITRADCEHEKTELRNAVAATCQQKGYSGDTWCLECGELLTMGAQTELADHSGGTATCISGKICSVCGTEYTEKDSANHVHKETRGQQDATCTVDGYTGDEFCADCGAEIGSGTAIAALGHDWHVTSQEEATTTTEGKRIYTCARCSETREETIPKLPEDHKHDYKAVVTKEASCTEKGERKYTCACGDSYTEGIPALGHSYESEVTKQPTASEEGVRTYTCSRCGDSYTRTIEKLAGAAGRPVESPQTGQPWIPWWIMAADALIIAMGIGGLFAARRKRA
nr:hypothetical protein [uncultured Acetatifactor sp.]